MKENEENQDEIEIILDYLYSEKPDISKIGYKTILEKTGVVLFCGIVLAFLTGALLLTLYKKLLVVNFIASRG